MGVRDWDGTRALAVLRERMNRLFDARLGRGEEADEEEFTPPTDVYSTPRHVVVTVEVPGIPESALKIELADRALTVRGHRAFPSEGSSYHRLERSFGDFSCKVALPTGTDVSSRTIRLEDGVLTVELSRSPAHEP